MKDVHAAVAEVGNYRSAVEDAPEDIVLVAEVAWASGLTEEAEALFAEARSVEGNHDTRLVQSKIKAIRAGQPQRLAMSNLLKAREKNKEYFLALKTARRLTRIHPRRSGDYKKRVRLLHRLGRVDVVNRYTKLLSRESDRARSSPELVAERLWAAHRPESALSILGGPRVWARSLGSARVALQCLVDLRRYREAGALLREVPANWRLPEKSVERVRCVVAYLDKEGIETSSGEDAAIPVIGRWIATLATNRMPMYESVSGRVVISSYSLGFGGSERQALSLAAALAADKRTESVRMLLHARREHTYLVDNVDPKLSVHLVGEDATVINEALPNPLFREVEKYARCFGLERVVPIVRELCSHRPEVLHVRSGQIAEMVIGALIASVPRILIHFGSVSRSISSTDSEFDALKQGLTDSACRFASTIKELSFAANSEAAGKAWAGVIGCPIGDVGVILNILDEALLGLSAPSFRRQTNRLTVGTVCRMDAVKDPLLWVEVAGEVASRRPDVDFLIVGDGPLRESVRRRVRSLGLEGRVTISGLVKRGVADAYYAMDVFLMTSQSESLPNAVIEAQLAGVPVVAPNIGGISEAIAGPDMAVLTERTKGSLANAVIQLLDDAEKRRMVSVEAPAVIRQRFSVQRVLPEVFSAYGWPVKTLSS